MTDVAPPPVEEGTASSIGIPRRPAPVLRPYVNQYLGYRQVGFPPGLHRGLPSKFLTFIVSIGDPIDVVVQTDPTQAPGRYGFVLGGLQATPAMIAHEGNQEGVSIELTPLGSRGLLGMPARALWNTTVEATDVLGPVAAELRERLHLITDWDTRFDIVDQVLARFVRDRSEVPPEIRQSWRLLVASQGTVSIGELAAEIGWSRRHLSQRFSDEFGYAPKLAARVIRFERARRLIQRPDRPSLADVAAVCGYYDQPHLNRDFVELAGCPPNEWIETELPSVQDGAPTEGAESLA
jgi:AraC-like DNA-binding protein